MSNQGEKSQTEIDVVDILEQEESLEVDIAEVTPWLGYHEPDYSLKPDRIIPLCKLKYTSYHEALMRFAEIASKYNLRLHKQLETARHYVFECFYIIETEDEVE